MINLIREYLLKLVDNIDAGNSNLTEDETIKLISVLKELTDRERRLSKYESCRYLDDDCKSNSKLWNHFKEN